MNPTTHNTIDADGVARNHHNGHNFTSSAMPSAKRPKTTASAPEKSLCSYKNGKRTAPNKLPERVKVEAFLQRATAPHTAAEISADTGLLLNTVRKIMGYMVNEMAVISHRKRGGNAYRLRKMAQAAQVTACTGAEYTPYKPSPDLPVRADGLDAYQCPSRVGGVEVAYAGIKSQCTGSVADGRSLGR